jgi:FKBP12-rapamycin complex-associated protein
VNQVPVAQLTTSSGSDDYYQTVVITSLLAILKDQGLSSHHHTVIEAIMSIFKTQGLKCVTFLPQVCRFHYLFMVFPDAIKIIPAFAAVTRSSAARLQEFHLQQLAILVGIIKQHIRNFVPAIFNMIKELWESTTLQLPIVSLIEALGKALDAELKQYLPSIFPLILKVFEGELTEKRISTQIKVFDAFLTFGVNIEEYLHLVIPIIVKSYERHDFPDRPESLTALRKRAIQTIDGLSRRINFSDHASRIIHPLVRVLEDGNNELRMAVMDTLCSLVIQLGSDFAIFVPTVNKVRVQPFLSVDLFLSNIESVCFGIAFRIPNTRPSSVQTSEW